MSPLPPDPIPDAEDPERPPPNPWAMVRGMAGMAGVILVLLALLVGWLHLKSVGPAREAAMGLVRERPEVAAALGMPYQRSVSINLFNLMPTVKVEGAYRFVMLLNGPEGWGIAEVHLHPFAFDQAQLQFRTLLGAWQPLPLKLIPERPGPQADARMRQALTVLQKGDPQRAHEELTEVLQLQPLLAPAWYLRALASRDLGRNQEALNDARWALELEHPDPELVILMEQVLPEHAPGSARVAAWASFLAYAPHSPVALARHAKARAEAGEVDGAVTFLERNCLQGSAEACKSLRELAESQVIQAPPAPVPPAATAR